MFSVCEFEKILLFSIVKHFKFCFLNIFPNASFDLPFFPQPLALSLKRYRCYIVIDKHLTWNNGSCFLFLTSKG